jgi:hypothetical protein
MRNLLGVVQTLRETAVRAGFFTGLEMGDFVAH